MIRFNKEYFNIEDTLFCGQVFRFKPYKNGYLVLSGNKACYLCYDGNDVVIESSSDDYFYNYFDLDRDYSEIVDYAVSLGNPFLTEAVIKGKGIRILKQDKAETVFSFLISQNNNIPRIKRTIEGLSEKLGEKFTAFDMPWYAFPTALALSNMSEVFFKSMGLGYRSDYFVQSSKILSDENFLNGLNELDTASLREKLLTLRGVGPKVCDCIMLFGYGKTDCFPVDTWIAKLYKENFKGTITDRKKISEYFVGLFNEYSGYVQQYLFHYKRMNNI